MIVNVQGGHEPPSVLPARWQGFALALSPAMYLGFANALRK